jgi:acetoin utilization deacetylase AcuC-like enzyme
MSLWFHPLYTDGIHPEARFPRDRYVRARDAVLARPDAHRIAIREPPLAGRADLCVAHDAGYVDAFLGGTLDVAAQRAIGLRPWTDALVPRTLALVGGTLAALEEAVTTGGASANMAGGTHHAFADRGAGYCVVNDLVIAARLARHRFGLRRTLIVDLDVHQGDGTAAMCQDDPDTFTFSMHGATNFPFVKQRSDLDVELPRGATDEAYLAALDRWLPEALAFDPDLVLFQGGVDPLAVDKLGHLSLTREGLAGRNARVLDAVEGLGVPVVVLMGGGYGRPPEATAEAFADLFLQAADHHARCARSEAQAPHGL